MEKPTPKPQQPPPTPAKAGNTMKANDLALVIGAALFAALLGYLANKDGGLSQLVGRQGFPDGTHFGPPPRWQDSDDRRAAPPPRYRSEPFYGDGYRDYREPRR